MALSQTIFGIKESRIRKDIIKKTEVSGTELCAYLIERFYYDILKAVITVAGAQVRIIPQDHSPHPHVRDAAIILPHKKLVIYCEGNKEFGALDILSHVKQTTNYQAIEIKDAYFEGGNTLYVANVLLHCLNPGGFYERTVRSASTYKINPKNYKISTAQTTKKLEEILDNKHGIKVHGLTLRAEVMNERDGYVHRMHYYHLDCFMQALPNGWVIILNKKILSDASQNLMAKIFGDNFIDLAYEGYLSHPVLLNFLSIQNKEGISLVSPVLPRSIINSLKQRGIRVMIPDSLNPKESAHYDERFAAQVATELQKVGYKSATSTNLMEHLPTKINGYLLDSGEFLPGEMVETVRKTCTWFDEMYADPTTSKAFRERFTSEEGGPPLSAHRYCPACTSSSG